MIISMLIMLLTLLMSMVIMLEILLTGGGCGDCDGDAVGGDYGVLTVGVGGGGGGGGGGCGGDRGWDWEEGGEVEEVEEEEEEDVKEDMNLLVFITLVLIPYTIHQECDCLFCAREPYPVPRSGEGNCRNKKKIIRHSNTLLAFLQFDGYQGNRCGDSPIWYCQGQLNIWQFFVFNYKNKLQRTYFYTTPPQKHIYLTMFK